MIRSEHPRRRHTLLGRSRHEHHPALESTWTTRELPILRSALRRLDAGENFPNLEEIRAEVGLDLTQRRAALRALENAWPHIEIIHAGMGPDRVGGYVNAVSERARRELGTWPSAEAVLDRLAAALAGRQRRRGPATPEQDTGRG